MNNKLFERILDLAGQPLQESLSSVVYHNTSTNSVIDILKDNRMIGGSSLGSKADNIQGKKPFFIAMSRIKYGGYARSLSSTSQACIVLDGDKLNQRYKGVSVDYWGPSWREESLKNIQKAQDQYDSLKKKYDENPDEGFYKELVDKAKREIDYNRDRFLRNNENEERVLMDKPYIDNIRKYIKEIHVLFIEEKEDDDLLTDRSYEELKRVGEIRDYCLAYKIDFYQYDNLKDYKLQKRGKRVSDNREPRFVSLLRAYHGDDSAFENLSRYEDDNISSISNEIHRPDKKYIEQLGEFARVLKKEKTDVKGLVKKVFGQIYKAREEKWVADEESKTVDYYVDNYRESALEDGIGWLEKQLEWVKNAKQSSSGYNLNTLNKKEEAFRKLADELRMKELAGVS